MLDELFSFVEPVIDFAEYPLVQMMEDFLLVATPDAIKNLPVPVDSAVPIDIALSLLKPSELEKLKNYIASYVQK